jgi:hypothetical protein
VSNVIRFLEAVGSKPLSAAEYVAGVSLLDIDPARRQALMDRDQAGLKDLLGGRNSMQCMIMVPDEG